MSVNVDVIGTALLVVGSVGFIGMIWGGLGLSILRHAGPFAAALYLLGSLGYLGFVILDVDSAGRSPPRRYR